MSEQAADVMRRENRRHLVISEVARALDEASALEREARAEAEKIIAAAEVRAAQIVADALNNSKAATDEIAAQLGKLEQDKARLTSEITTLRAKVKQERKPVKPE